MEIEIINRIHKAVLFRDEVTFVVTHENESTPSRSVVASKLAAMVNADKSRTVIIKMDGVYGQHAANGLAHIYDSDEKALELEGKHFLKRNGLVAAEETE